MKPIYIETARMLIRNFIQEDAAGLYEILGDEEVMQYCEPAYGFTKTRDFLNTFCIGQNGAVAAVHKDSGRLIGYILCRKEEEGVYEMGWFFHKEFWRQGYAFESCRAVAGFLFGERKAHKIFAETIDTGKSLGMMEKLGMRPEGIQRGQVRDRHGNWADMHFYGVLSEEWRSAAEGPQNRTLQCGGSNRGNHAIGEEMYCRAAALIEKRYPTGWGGAGVVHTAGGHYFTSVSIDTANASAVLCIETGAILEAHKCNEKVTHCMCLVREGENAPYKVLTPCGICQERLRFWGEDVQVAVTTGDGSLQFAPLGELQPYHWTKAYPVHVLEHFEG